MASDELKKLIDAYGSLEVIPTTSYPQIAKLLDDASPKLLEEIYENRVKFLWRMAQTRLNRRREAAGYDENGIASEAQQVKQALEMVLNDQIEEKKKEELTNGDGEAAKKGIQFLLPNSKLSAGAFNPEPNMDGINPHFFDDVNPEVVKKVASEMSRVAAEADPTRFDSSFQEQNFWL